jgi:hypothetical protein
MNEEKCPRPRPANSVRGKEVPKRSEESHSRGVKYVKDEGRD